jgi:hypothetical protein
MMILGMVDDMIHHPSETMESRVSNSRWINLPRERSSQSFLVLGLLPYTITGGGVHSSWTVMFLLPEQPTKNEHCHCSLCRWWSSMIPAVRLQWYVLVVHYHSSREST